MDEDKTPEQASLFPKSTGDKLREAREAQGLTLADIASRTRVPTRHLEAIEQGDYKGMPSPTYAIGFARSYARAVGLDDREIAAEVRNNPQLPAAPVTDYQTYQPDDYKRVPSRGLAMIAGLIGLAVLIGAVIWFGSTLLRGSGETTAATPTENTVAAAPEPTPTPVATGGQVSLTATDSVWVKVYDGTGKTLVEKTLAAGERYDVPADADNPMINVGRPDKLQVTLNGSVVAPLGDGKVAIKDVPVSAAALQARGTGQPVATPTADATASTAPTPAPADGPAVPPAFRPASQPATQPAPRATSRPESRPTPRRTPRARPTPENLLPPGMTPTP